MGPQKALMMALLFLLVLSGFNQVQAYCQCGYRSLIDTTVIVDGSKAAIDEFGGIAHVNTNTDPRRVDLAKATPYVWTDVLETDFFHLDDITKDTDWQIQNYSVSAKAARGPFGMQFDPNNVKLNRISNPTNWTGPGELGGDPGLQLSVGVGATPDGFTRCAQLNTVREDMIWGSYRVLLKLPSVAGTCSAFFWYFNDSQEIDMELLSSQFSRVNNTFLINLVHQSPQSAAQGFSNVGKDYMIVPLPFDPTAGFGEFRIDYLPEKIFYYFNGQVLAVMNSTVSPQPGHLILTQWSNGDPGWSAGPPVEPAILSIGYIKAYFNSSNPVRQADALRRCSDPSEAGAICDIEDYTAPVNITNPATADLPVPALNSPFFYNRPNMTNNQTVYGSAAEPEARPNGWLITIFLLLTTVLHVLNLIEAGRDAVQQVEKEAEEFFRLRRWDEEAAREAAAQKVARDGQNPQARRRH